MRTRSLPVVPLGERGGTGGRVAIGGGRSRTATGGGGGPVNLRGNREQRVPAFTGANRLVDLIKRFARRCVAYRGRLEVVRFASGPVCQQPKWLPT